MEGQTGADKLLHVLRDELRPADPCYRPPFPEKARIFSPLLVSFNPLGSDFILSLRVISVILGEHKALATLQIAY